MEEERGVDEQDFVEREEDKMSSEDSVVPTLDGLDWTRSFCS